MYVARGVRVHEQQAVVGIRQRAVGGESDRCASREHEIEARVLAACEAPAEDLRREAVRGQRNQLVADELQDGGGITRERTTHGLEDASEPILGRQRGGEVECHGKQRIGQLHALFLA